MATLNNSSNGGDLYQRTTDRIIEALEQGTVPWIKPWTSASASGIPTNLATGKEYRGINVISLWCASVSRGFERDQWLTYKQAQEKGWQVRKGAKAEYIVKMGTGTTTDEDEKERTFSYLKSYAVFNVAEVDGVPELPTTIVGEHEPIEAAEAFAKQTGADIREGGDRACYIPSIDAINVPKLGRFEDAGSYYSTLLHELTHWTGAKPRLDRTFGKRFGDEAYAVEELVAEIGSAFLCAHLGIEGQLQHPEYLAHWLKVLGQDKRAIFTAAAKASQAADFLRAFGGEEVGE
jgi:antirestriction protein ArdC